MLSFWIAAAVGAATAPHGPTPPSPMVGIRDQSNKSGTTAGMPADVRAKIAACNANILVNTIATIKVKGQLRKTRVLLCTTPGQTAAQKTATLQKAIVAVKANPQLPADEIARIVALMQAKLAELANRT